MPRNGFRKVKRPPAMQHDPLVLDIDCSKADLFVRDRKDGKSYQPWLTTFINKDTRTILGSSLSDGPPSYRSVMERLLNAFFPKRYTKNELIGTLWKVDGFMKGEVPKKRKGIPISEKEDSR